MVDRRRAADYDRWKLLDVATQPRHQPRPGCLASGARGPGALGMFCSRERSRLSLYAAGVARGRHRLIESPTQRGGSVGVSLSQTFQERRDQFHVLRLGESLDPFNPAVSSFLEQARGVFLQQTGDPVAAQQLAWQALENLRQ